MKIIDFNEAKAEKNGENTPKEMIADLLNEIEQGEVKSVVYVVNNKDGTISVGRSDMLDTQSIGLLEVGKRMLIDDMYRVE